MRTLWLEPEQQEIFETDNDTDLSGEKFTDYWYGGRYSEYFVLTWKTDQPVLHQYDYAKVLKRLLS